MGSSLEIYSKPSKIAVYILSHMAEEVATLYSARDVSQLTSVPGPTVSKMLHLLAKDGILESRKGPGGGFRMAVPPQELTLGRIISAVEGEDLYSKCIWGFAECSDSKPCPLHQKWTGLKEQLETFFYATTLQDMVDALQQERKDVEKQSITISMG
jgi:Rrf2 family protein